MQWWNDFSAWFSSADGGRVISTAILPFIAIIVGALVAAWIGRASIRRVLGQQDRELKAAAIMSLIGAGRKAAIWSSLGVDEKQHVDSLISEADIRVRLLPVNGAYAAADWAAHELAGMKKNSATFSFQADQSFIDYRDRLLEWQDKPRRARKLFAFDLDQWRFEDTSATGITAQALASAPPPVAHSPSSTPVAPAPYSTPASPSAPTADSETASPLTPEQVSPEQVSPAPHQVAPEPVAEVSQREEIPGASAPNWTAAEALSGNAALLNAPAPQASPAARVPVAPVEYSTEDEENDGVDDPVGDYAPPINAGAVRKRIVPETDR